MDPSEALAESYLKNCGYQDIRYEPDGNVPPDFLVDGRIAVEVRRLNQNHKYQTSVQGLEEAAIPLWLKFREYLASLGVPTRSQSWFVFYSFSRPVPPWRTLRAKLNAVLLPFMQSAEPRPFEVSLGDGFDLRIAKATREWPTFFLPGGYSDHESGGFLIGEMEQNLKLCIAEKTIKVAKVRAKYPEWWLILPDHIGYGLDDFDREIFRDQVSLEHNFNKIILLDPRNPARFFEA